MYKHELTGSGGARALLADGSGDIICDVDGSSSASVMVAGDCAGDCGLQMDCDRRLGMGVSEARSASNETRRRGLRFDDRRLLRTGRSCDGVLSRTGVRCGVTASNTKEFTILYNAVTC